MVPRICTLQGKLQGSLSPGSWLPVVRRFHGEEQVWTFQMTQAEAIAKLEATAKALKDENFRVASVDDKTVVIHFYTKAGWLDKFTFTFFSTEKRCKCDVIGTSTGFLPLIIPLAPVVNVLLCWIPFGDFGKLDHSLTVLRKKFEQNMNSNIHVDLTAKSFTRSVRK